MRNVLDSAARIVQSAVEEFGEAAPSEVRKELQASRVQCASVLKRVEAHLADTVQVHAALERHAALSARVKELDSIKLTPYDLILTDVVDVAVNQESAAIDLQRRITKLVSLYSLLSAKCEALSRTRALAVPLPTQNIPDYGTNNEGALVKRNDNNSLVPVQSDGAGGAERSTLPPMFGFGVSAPVVVGGPPSSAPRIAIRMGVHGRALFSTTTREAPQSIYGEPGAHYPQLSNSRRKVPAQHTAQSEAVTRSRNVQRTAAQKRKRDDLQNLIAPHTDLYALMLTNGPAFSNGGGGDDGVRALPANVQQRLQL
jgi:hypothetical protein